MGKPPPTISMPPGARLGSAQHGRMVARSLELPLHSPVEADGSCYEDDFQRMIAKLMTSAPADTRFDE
jgi:hypothetical protein